MPLHKVKSRVRFQIPKKKVKQDDGGKAQCKLERTVFGGASESTLVKGLVDDEPLFAKKRVPSTDELGDVLRSNLSSSLAAAKAYEALQDTGKSLPSPTCQHIERLQEEDDDPPASLLELAPIYRPIPDRLVTTGTCTIESENGSKDDGPSASLLTTTAIHRPVNDHIESANSRAVAGEHAEQANERTTPYGAIKEASRLNDDQLEPVIQVPATPIYRRLNDHTGLAGSCVVVSEDKVSDSPASLLGTADASVHEDTEPSPRTPPIVLTAADSCAIKDDDGPPASLLVETQESFIKYVKPVLRSSTEPVQLQKDQSTLLQRVVTLFAGRRRCQDTEEELPSAPEPAPKQHASATTSSPSSPQSDPAPRLADQKQETTPTTSSSPIRSPPPPRRATVYFGGTTPRKPIHPKNLPLSPPVIAPRRPYRPIDEHPHAPFIEPAKEHKYTGTHFIAPDVFEPVKIQLGFSDQSPTSPISPVRRQNLDSKLLDRDETVWGRWYAKNPTAEHLPFAKANSSQQRRDNQAEEVTEQQTWDLHAARHAKFRKARPPPASDGDLSRRAEDAEHERAARLRYHPGHCFGALTGDVYPFQGGLII